MIKFAKVVVESGWVRAPKWVCQIDFYQSFEIGLKKLELVPDPESEPPDCKGEPGECLVAEMLIWAI